MGPPDGRGDREVAPLLGRLGPAGRGAHVVHNAVDLTSFERSSAGRAEARELLEIEGDGVVLAVIAQITPWKAQDDAIEIAAE